MAKKFRPQYEFSDELIVSLATRLGVEELITFNNERVSLLPKEEQKKIKDGVKELIFNTLLMVAESAAPPMPTNAILLDDESKIEYWKDLSKRTDVGPNEIKAPAEVLAERFRTKVGQPIRLTESELATEALRVYHERGQKSKTMRDVIRESIAARCQSVVSKYLQSKYGSPTARKVVDYAHFELALALLQKSLDNFQNGDGQGCELTWIVDGEKSVYDVPAWKLDNDGNGYRNQYAAVTPSYIIKACNAAPINKMVNLTKVTDWIKDNSIQGITSKIKGNQGD